MMKIEIKDDGSITAMEKIGCVVVRWGKGKKKREDDEF